MLGGAPPDVEQFEREMPYLDMVLDEVLRLYPPAWIGPRRAVREFEFGGYTVPRAPTSTTAPGPATACPRSSPSPRPSSPSASPASARRALPRGAYVPFGGGQRVCIGKRFGQTEVKLVTTMLLQRLRLDALPGRTMTVRQMPTLSPQGGLRMRARPARLDSARSLARAGHLRHPLRRLDRARPPARGVLPRAPGAALEGIDELIFLGDLFDFLFGSVAEAVDAAGGLLALIAEKMPGKRLVFLAGNHDHHLVHRDDEDRLEAALARGAVPGAEARAAVEPPGPAFFQSFLEARLPGVEVEIAYPTYSFAGVLCTHGHYLDPHARLSGSRGSTGC